MNDFTDAAPSALVRHLVGWSSAVIAVTVFVLGAWAARTDAPARRLVIWGLTGEGWFLISLVIGFAATAVALATLPGLLRWFAALPAAATVIVFVLAGFVAEPPMTNLEVEGCTSPYLVAEQQSGDLRVYEQDGIYAIEVLVFPAKDAAGVFRNDRYRTQIRGEVLDVWYESSSPRWPRSINGDPAFAVPAAPLSCH